MLVSNGWVLGTVVDVNGEVLGVLGVVLVLVDDVEDLVLISKYGCVVSIGLVSVLMPNVVTSDFVVGITVVVFGNIVLGIPNVVCDVVCFLLLIDSVLLDTNSHLLPVVISV